MTTLFDAAIAASLAMRDFADLERRVAWGIREQLRLDARLWGNFLSAAPSEDTRAVIVITAPDRPLKFAGDTIRKHKTLTGKDKGHSGHGYQTSWRPGRKG